VFDSLTFGGNHLLHFVRNPAFEFVKGDIRDKADVGKAVKDQDVIVHLAAIVGYPACSRHPRLAEEVNVGGAKNLIGAAAKNQIILYASTGSNYGNVDEICTEETPVNPLSVYGETKSEAERILLERHHSVAYRFATAFGVSPRLRLDLMINDFVYKSVSQGYLVVYEKHFMRTFIHVHDMARAFLFGLEHLGEMTGRVYNVGSDSMNYSKERICELIKCRLGCYVHYADIGEDKDKRNYVVSYKKINDLGYSTIVTIEQGIDELIRSLAVIDTKLPYMNI
jgi:nucleoside-diphosphate-sugar epimerase